MSQQYDYERFFPFSNIRDEQRRAIEFALDAFVAQGKKYVIAELGTGVGKSATGLTIARYLNANFSSTKPEEEQYTGAYVLTTQKVLQEQYVNDFGPDKLKMLRSIKSSSNYTCAFYTDQNCGESRRLLNRLGKTLVGTEFFNCCRRNCKYSLDKQAFIESPVGITNFSYFLAETMYAGRLEPRELLVIDECHNIESELSKFIEVTFSERFARDILKCKAPSLRGDEETRSKTVFEWVKKTYKTALAKHIASLERLLESKISSGSEGLGEYTKQYEMLDKHICKVNRFIDTYNPENWVLNIVEPPPGTRAAKKFEFKPIVVSSYADDMLYKFGEKVLLMSATIIDKDVFCRTVGIPPEEAAFLRIPSPFPIENRPIHVLNVGKMSFDNINATLPKVAQVVGMLLDQHKDDKGIIHCTSFKVAQYIFENVKSDRLLIHNSENREQVLKNHISGKKPTVLLSPSMMEGVDLRDDASRFQILCKVPFPYLGDKMIKKRKSRDPQWYPFQTAKSVIQAMGRSVRNETDHAVSYILDADWEFFFQKNRGMFPEDFVRSIKVH